MKKFEQLEVSSLEKELNLVKELHRVHNAYR